jgi:hypothetical protein
VDDLVKPATITPVEIDLPVELDIQVLNWGTIPKFM